VHDLARFALFHLKSPLPDQKPPLLNGAIDEMHRGSMLVADQRRYGIGWFDERKDGYRFLWHTGGMGGVATDLHLFPDQDIAIIAVANAHDRLPLEVVDRISALLLPNWRLQAPEPPRKAVPFQASPELVGTWNGTLSTYVADQPAQLIVRADGEMNLKFGNQLTALVNNARIEDGMLHGELRARVGTPDTERFPYFIELSLTMAPGHLSGAATAIDEESSRVRNALSSWLELTKTDK
jgi:CubicO group peptidase (beta-lactamase class C family)